MGPLLFPKNVIEEEKAKAMAEAQIGREPADPSRYAYAWLEDARERDGNAKFFGKMMLGGFTGTMPLLFPEAIGSNARYKQELKQYGEAMDRIALGMLQVITSRPCPTKAPRTT